MAALAARLGRWDYRIGVAQPNEKAPLRNSPAQRSLTGLSAENTSPAGATMLTEPGLGLAPVARPRDLADHPLGHRSVEQTAGRSALFAGLDLGNDDVLLTQRAGCTLAVE